MDNEFARDWFAFQRIQEIDAARRINFIRAIAVIVFFGIVLYRFYNSEKTESDYDYIWHSGCICGIWILLVVAIAVGLYRRTYPSLIKYLTVLCDAALLTAVARIGESAESTLVVIYFVIIACSFLRFSKLLVGFSTVVCVLGYLLLVYRTPSYWENSFPYVEVLRMVAGLVVMGLIGGQLCRGCRLAILRVFEDSSEVSQ